MVYQIKSEFNIAYINAKDSTVYDSIIETKDTEFTTKRVLNV